MRVGCVLLVGRSVSDMRADDDEGGARDIVTGRGDGGVQRLEVVGSITDVLNVPPVSFESVLDIIGERQASCEAPSIMSPSEQRT